MTDHLLEADTEASMRDLRNDTRSVLQKVSDGQTVQITNRGEPVAVITQLPSQRLQAAQELLAQAGADTGWLEEMAEDDALSMDDMV